ncbi:hypothetical protein IM660_18935 [Ruania alkalisoli]|uniref:Uncharacterized protein n=1 Tax=Ruania alkalisoli TaxID=2779775 RepID=A0A7M1SSS7_9MICO|nr:hypothetical protein [Ruania alkalisoli]QOR70628.1 hypothetical protein IM660_18935 [Ruania alkalisoli]
MGREESGLPEERRTRLRAAMLSTFGALTVIAAIAAVYALAIGFPVVSATPVEAVAIAGERDLLVRYQVGSSSCHDPNGVEVLETEETVELQGTRVDPTGTRIIGKGCTDDLLSAVETVRLDDPLGDRRIVRPDGTELEPVDQAQVLGLAEDT